MELAGRRFESEWRLELPEASVEIVVPRGAASALVTREARPSLGFLGHEVSGEGSVAKCWQRAQGAARAALWRQLAAARRARLPMEARMRLLDRFVWPVIAYRAPAWPPSQWLRGRVDLFQRWAITQVQSQPRYPHEDVLAFFRRRGRAAGAAARSDGLWSLRLVKAASAMYASVREERPPRTWPAVLLPYRDDA